jgi:hypothetical protein
MLTMLVFLTVTSGVVALIEWNSNHNYYSVVRLHNIHLDAAYKATLDGVSNMSYSDIAEVLVDSRICVELSNELYFNSIHHQLVYGNRHINKLDCVRLLTYLLAGHIPA